MRTAPSCSSDSLYGSKGDTSLQAAQEGILLPTSECEIAHPLTQHDESEVAFRLPSPVLRWGQLRQILRNLTPAQLEDLQRPLTESEVEDSLDSVAEGSSKPMVENSSHGLEDQGSFSAAETSPSTVPSAPSLISPAPPGPLSSFKFTFTFPTTIGKAPVPEAPEVQPLLPLLPAATSPPSAPATPAPPEALAPAPPGPPVVCGHRLHLHISNDDPNASALCSTTTATTPPPTTTPGRGRTAASVNKRKGEPLLDKGAGVPLSHRPQHSKEFLRRNR
ncbi:hypothetical protein B0O80DRAFT_218026 [Mortierella sp. GBAus27b]|nr:hypothetical protein B0O80DRAFT_218026 [Mortierella sp. GBAus27b]